MKLVGRVPRITVEEEGMVRLDHPPYDIVVVGTEDGFFALEDTCNHGSASLSEGWLEDRCLVCPQHQYAFDLATGALVRPSGLCADQRTFVTRVEGDQIAVYDVFQLVIVGS